MIVEYCKACDKKIAVHYDGDLNRTDDGGGPFCDGCWFFVQEIENLQERVSDLEGPPPMHSSPYDLSRRRIGRK